MTDTNTQTQPGWRWYLLLTLLSIILYLPPALFTELQSGEEAGYAAIAREIVHSGNALQPRLQGNPAPVFPLYAWLVAAFSFGAPPSLLAIRLPAILSIFGMAILAGRTAFKYKGNLAGFIAAAVVLTSLASFRIGIRAQTETVHAFFLAMAWFSWYRFGPQEQHWHHAWGIALLFVFLDVLTVGAKGIFFFYLPLLFTRNPPQTFRQLQSGPHFLMLGIFAVMSVFWVNFVCPQPFLPWDALPFSAPTATNHGFFSHLFTFPAKVATYLLPWGLLIWTPFCLALRPFEPKGTLCGFLRALVFVPFVLFWFLPSSSPLQLMPALAPIAVLIGIHFEITMNWYGRFFRWIVNTIHTATIASGVLFGLFWGLVLFGNLEIRPLLLAHANFIGTAQGLLLFSALLACIAGRLLKMQKEIPLWKGFLLSTALLRLVLLVGFLFVPYMTIGNRKLAGLALAGTAPAEAWQPIPDPVSGTEPPTPRSLATDPNANTVYLQSTSPFLVETFYMNKNIVRLPAADLPEETSVVYLLSHRQPAIPSRQWEPVSPTVPIAPRRDFLFQLPSAENQYRGILSREVLTHFPERTEDQSFEEAKRNSLRLYRGVLRSPLPPASEPNKTEETL